MRLFIVDAGMPEPDVQVEVHDPATGLLLGRADLAHRDARVVEEYEGEGHRSKGQWDRDIQKYRAFERVGLQVVRATKRDLVPSPDRWCADLAAVLQRRIR
jgi:very-short-patch-repair endonuclease